MASEVRDEEDVCSLELRDYPGTFPAAKFSAEHTPNIRSLEQSASQTPLQVLLFLYFCTGQDSPSTIGFTHGQRTFPINGLNSTVWCSRVSKRHEPNEVDCLFCQYLKQRHKNDINWPNSLTI